MARSGVLVRISRLGLFGPKLFAESDMSRIAAVCQDLSERGAGHSVLGMEDYPTPCAIRFSAYSPQWRFNLTALRTSGGS